MPIRKAITAVASQWFAILLITVMAATGCAPSQKEVAGAKFGPPPDRCESLVQQQMDLTVFAGQQGDYLFEQPPYKAAISRKLFAPYEFGWVMEFQARGPLFFGTGGYRTYHYFFPWDGSMALLTGDATIHRIEQK